MPRRVYWDACAFLGLINKEADKHADCLAVWREAEAGQIVIFTSFFTYAEVFKAKCEGKAKPLAEAEDNAIEGVLGQDFIEPVVVDEVIGVAARRLMRAHEDCKKPTDGIHLATALRLNVDEMHTYDGSDLLHLNVKVNRADGTPLIICVRVAAPRPAQDKEPAKTRPAPLLDYLESADETDKGG